MIRRVACSRSVFPSTRAGHDPIGRGTSRWTVARLFDATRAVWCGGATEADVGLFVRLEAV